MQVWVDTKVMEAMEPILTRADSTRFLDTSRESSMTTRLITWHAQNAERRFLSKVKASIDVTIATRPSPTTFLLTCSQL